MGVLQDIVAMVMTPSVDPLCPAKMVDTQGERRRDWEGETYDFKVV